MNTFLVILLIAAMAMVLLSLVRGVVAFLQSTKVDLETGEQQDATEMQLKQNKAMMARVKWQAIAILIIAVLLGVAT
ncbi:HIG1 domain-containing protein [Qipengyuania flava]|uniref:HIG1 domain-containing protein n=1 Tax=Qipengyuania aestuarii TaxID=2867241 RepID=UPI001C86D9C4|nr:HIG1 domain-containing protein [Qipengyuania aestuarii]MBX7536382.1 HIG1 domain-containing protein [Qipengyuania aestuarii]MCA0979115.1 HIG1 domain-containing protein [Qipengyuania flava]